MAEDREEDRGFTVHDRRRFSAETGEARPNAEEGRGDGEGGQRQGQGDESSRGSASAGEGSPREPQGPETPRGRSGKGAPVPEITLSTFIMSLSTQVLMLMGEIQDPTGRKVERDMNGAKQVIDILGMLKEKTKGNLDKTEEALLDNVLYDLRIRYVQLLRSDAQQ
jgi:hypothetical protein